MDDTQQSRASDAAATRKRRSSILKSQRPTRTPFSELEFNVATPTDTAKSRRVSFSRRTGVAEFVTNEATTTWKNFYEEHNKSLESSSNDSGANASRQPVGHLGRRIFDQQFEEVETVDFIGHNPSINSNGSLNNVNFTQQLASLECTSDGRLTAPQNNFELSAFTDQQSKLFGNDFTAACVNEISGRIDVNFSAMQPVGDNDDLDEMQRDIERASTNMGCHGPFSDRRSMSEYIEVDLNLTHADPRNEEDMSITDTVHSPVQDVSKSNSVDKKVSLNHDWAIDKENIAVNPYAAPRESVNFAINDEPDQVLVFDGKRLTIQPDKPEKDKNYRKTLLPNSSAETPQRKTIVLNVNDDLPNFVDDMLNSKCENSGFSGLQDFKPGALDCEDEISMALPVNRVDIVPKRKTILDNTSIGNISMSQALPTNILSEPRVRTKDNSEKRRTIVFEEGAGNISVTQSLPIKIINNNGKLPERRRTVVYEDETGNISITQAVPSNILDSESSKSNEKRKTIVFDDDAGNISVTQAIPSNIIQNEREKDKRRTIVFDDDAGNISVTQAIPSNIIQNEREKDKRRTIVFDDDKGNISVTQSIPSNIILNERDKDKRKTIVFDDDGGNVSVTQSIPSNIILNERDKDKRKTRKVFNDDGGNISVTQAIPSNIILNKKDKDKRNTMVFDDDGGNISVTQAIPSNIILNERGKDKRKTIVFDDDAADVSITQALPANIVANVVDGESQERRRTIIYEDNTGNISVTQAIPSNVILAQSDKVPERRRTVVYEDDTGNISVTQALPTNILLERIEFDGEPKNYVEMCPSTQPINITIKDSDVNKRRTIVYEDDTGNISITQAIPTQLIPGFESKSDILFNAVEGQELNNSGTYKAKAHKRTTIVYDNDDDVSMTEAIPANIILSDEVIEKRKTVIFDNEEANISMTQAIATNVFLLENLDSGVDQSINKVLVQEVENVIDYEVCEEKAPIPTMEVEEEIHQTFVVHTDDCSNDDEISISESVPKVQTLIQETETRKTVIFDNDNANISTTKPIPAELLDFQNEILNKSKSKHVEFTEPEELANPSPDVIVYQASTTQSTPKSNRTEQGDLKSDRPIDSNANSEVKVHDDVVSSAEVSTDISLIHPRVEEKRENINLRPSPVAMEVDKEIGRDVDIKVEKDIENYVEKEVENNIEKNVNVTVIQHEPAIEETINTQTIDKPEDSVLNVLLDMSTTTVQSGTEDKDITASVESNHSTAKDTATSSESMFYITRDSDDGAQTDKEMDMDKKSIKPIEAIDIPAIKNHSPLPLEFKEETKEVTDLQKKLEELKSAVTEEKHTSVNRFYEKIVSKDLEGIVERDENVKLREQSLNFKKANDTQELLDMISDFTDKKDDDDEESIVIRVKGHPALENKEVPEPKRISIAPRRQSIALSREDLLNNISMAQAALQKSRLALDESESMEEDTKDDTIEQISHLSKKFTRTSNEVVKTLHFDDESFSETSIKSDAKASPLKKTAFGETAYMTESKGKVIPTYLKDVSDGIKELMLDLVKPMNDNMPFESSGVDKSVRKIPSTQSTQIQANLITSSQVDIDSELYSNPDSGYEMDKMSSVTGGALHKSRSRSFRSPVKFSTNSSERSSEFEVPSPRQRYMYSHGPVEKPPHPKVLVFDHLNPLNNILLGCMDYSDAHKYNPKKSDETLCGSERSHSALIHFDDNIKDNDHEVEKVSTQYRMETQIPGPRHTQSHIIKRDDDQHSIISNISKPISIDQSVDVKILELTDKEVNTLIAMKGGKELLEASSSLTLVDDALAQPSDKDSESITTTSQDDEISEQYKVKVSKSPVKIMYAIEEQEAVKENISKLDSTSQSDEPLEHNMKNKAKKRIYSPAADKYKPIHSAVDVTPKPNIKMQKISNSPNVYKSMDMPVTQDATKIAEETKIAQETTKMAAEKDVPAEPIDQKGHSSKMNEKKWSRKSKDKAHGANITVQQLITDYHMDEGINPSIIDKQILNALNPKSDSSTAPASQSDVLECNSLEVVSSFTSSKNLNAVTEALSMSTTQSQQSAIHSKGSRVDWHPELISAISSNLTDSDSGVNVVAKIDMLPFMGSHECEWETSSADTWSFRLLHGRLRLTARLAHRHDNSTRTRVRGDTPVLDVGVETVQHDKKNPVATLCVRFACETMRYMVSKACRGQCFASDIPPLLRRCAAVARVALRWGRAMHDAKLHLAYTLDNDGYLTLKVANIPLRSVWEVSMRVELVVDDAREAPWPRAGGVKVARVVSDVSVSDADVRRALAHTPRDWGHAPRTIWRMFRYLKHKTRDDDLLLGA